jgi:hypothetical protein
MLRTTNIMGTVIGTRREMQALKTGKATCVLKPRFTLIKPWVKYVALHAGVAVRGGGWSEELVARLRNTKRGGGCVLGPFTSAKALWDASQDGMCFQLGMPFKQLQYLMRQRKVLYVYRFYPAEVCPKLVWTDLPGGEDEWSGFVRCRNLRGNGMRFYVVNEVSRSVCKPRVLSAAQWTVMQAKRKPTKTTALATTGVRSHHDQYVIPGTTADSLDALATSGGTTGVGNHHDQYVIPGTTAGSLDAMAMARQTREAAQMFLTTARANGANITVVIALEGIGQALAGIEQAIRANCMRWLLEGLYDLHGAIGEYGWAVGVTGGASTHVERVRELYLAIGRVRENVERSVGGSM